MRTHSSHWGTDTHPFAELSLRAARACIGRRRHRSSKVIFRVIINPRVLSEESMVGRAGGGGMS